MQNFHPFPPISTELSFHPDPCPRSSHFIHTHPHRSLLPSSVSASTPRSGGNRISQGNLNRGAETETPKASMGWGMGRGYPPPHPTRGSGKRRKLPQRGPGRSPPRTKTILMHLKHHRILQVALPEIS